MKLPTHGRYQHSAIPHRPTYEWSNGSRLAVVLCNNIEAFAFRAGLGSDSTGAAAPQSQRNYAWRDYGNRVGLWNMLAMFDEYGLPAAHNVNGLVLDTCPEIAPALMKRGDEFIGHGRTNAERQDILFEDDERRLIAESREAIIRHTGKAPDGWLGPYITQSATTLDLLKEEGFSYVMDWPADDQPFWMTTRAGPMLSVPYSVEVNDSPVAIFRQQAARDFADMVVDQFDEMLDRSRDMPLVCSIVLHPFIIGQPFRLRPFRRAMQHILTQRDKIWLARPGEIARHAASLPKGIVPGSEMLP